MQANRGIIAPQNLMALITGNQQALRTLQRRICTDYIRSLLKQSEHGGQRRDWLEDWRVTGRGQG
jgi:hypothetical protein